MSVLDRNVNVMDDRGLILASGQADRLNQRQEGALLAAQQDRVVVIDDSEPHLLQGVQPGVNVPLHHHGRVVGVVGISGSPDDVQVYADLIKVTAELVVEQSALLERGQVLQQEREDFLTEVIHERVEPAVAQRRSTELGVAWELRRGCTLVRSTTADTEPLRTLQRNLRHVPDLLIARPSTSELAVWWPVDQSAGHDAVGRAIEAAGSAVIAADGEPFDGIQALRRAWMTAHDALDVLHLAPDLYERRDLGVVALFASLRGDWRAETLSGPWRDLVAADPHGELRATLRAWIDYDLQMAPCAAALHLHRNTLRGRLDRIERITGLSLRRVPSLLQLYVGPLLSAGGALDDDIAGE